MNAKGRARRRGRLIGFAYLPGPAADELAAHDRRVALGGLAAEMAANAPVSGKQRAGLWSGRSGPPRGLTCGAAEAWHAERMQEWRRESARHEEWFLSEHKLDKSLQGMKG